MADKFNSRVLYFPAGSTLASRVYGQFGSFTTNAANNGGVSADSLAQPDSVGVDRGGNLYVTDRFNHRVLFYTPGSTTATRVYGQAGSFITGTINKGGLSASGLASPAGMALDASGNLYLSDLSNNRVVRFDVAPPVITAAPLTAILTAAGKTYDGTTTEPDAALSCTVSGVLPADSGNVTCAATSGTFDSAAAGPRTVTATVAISGPASGNYTLTSSTATASATIAGKSLSATITAENKVYDGTTSATIQALLGGVTAPDVVTVSGSGTFATKNVGLAKTVTSSDLTLGGPNAGNYTLASATLTTAANITTKSLTATITADGKVYDGTTTATIHAAFGAGVIAPDVVTVSGTGTFATKNVGTAKTVTSSNLALDGADAGNYALSVTTATAMADVTAKALTASITADNKVYDGTTTATIDATLGAGVIAPDVVSVGGSGTFDTKNVGTAKTVTSSNLALNGADAGNYALSVTTATAMADVTAKSLTASITADSKVYDGTLSATIHAALGAGVIAPDVVTVSGSGTFDTKNAGTAKTVTSSDLALNGTGAGNYALSSATATTSADITQATLTATANNKTRTSSMPNPAFDGTLTGVVSGDGITAAYSTTATSGSPVGTYAITPSLVDPNGKLGNYSVTLTPGTLTVTNEAPTVTVPSNISTEATGPSGAVVTFASSASDLEDGLRTPTCTPASGATFSLGATTVTCTVTDSGGLSASGSFTITVSDTTKPAVSVAGITVQQTSPAGAVGIFASSATDLVDGALTPTCTPASGSTFVRGVATVTCSVTDAHANTGTATATVTVQDTIKPVVTYSGNAATYTADQTINITCAATDSGSGVATTTCANVTGPAHSFAVGVNTRSASATDVAGNTNTATLTFTVTVPPSSVSNVITQFFDSPSEAAKANHTLTQATSAPNASARAAHLDKLKKDIGKEIGKSLTAAEAATLISLLNNLY